MTKTILAAVAIAFALIVSAFTFLEVRTVRALEQVGIPSDVVKGCVWFSFSGGYLSYPTIAKVKQVAVGQRAAVVREIAEFAKSYTRSEEFRTKYLEYRDGLKPTPPEALKSMAQRRREDKEQMQKSIRDTETSMRTMPAEYRPAMQQTLEMFRQQHKEIDNPNNPMYSAQMEEMYRRSYEASMQEYNTKLAQWKIDYPSNPTPMIKTWLTKFLEISRDVDFTAALKPGQFGKMEFVRPEYEGKPSDWKMCFRAGRETVQAGRTAAQQWLRELQ